MTNVLRGVGGLTLTVLLYLCISCGGELHEATVSNTTSATEDVAHALQLYSKEASTAARQLLDKID